MMARRHAGTQTHTTRKTQRPQADRSQHCHALYCRHRPSPSRIAGDVIYRGARRTRRGQQDRCARGTGSSARGAEQCDGLQRNPAQRSRSSAGPGSGGARHAIQRLTGPPRPFSANRERYGERDEQGIKREQKPLDAGDAAAGSHEYATDRKRHPALTGRSACDGLAGASLSRKGSGAPEEIRTPNLLIRSQVLYPVELRVRDRRGIPNARQRCNAFFRPIPVKIRGPGFRPGAQSAASLTSPVYYRRSPELMRRPVSDSGRRRETETGNEQIRAVFCR
jgi:hypothetical protein